MPTVQNYPVFEPDQVLTDTQLNNLFAYLDGQDQLTRNKLIGIGIVCGLNSWYEMDTIRISNGVAVTSLGYLMVYQGDTYTHYRPYTLPDFPYTIDPAVHAYYEALHMLELVPESAPKRPEDTALKADAATIKESVLLLFIEPAMTDLKNCTTEDCNDKGKRVDLRLRPVLINMKELLRQELPGFLAGEPAFPEVHLRRWNVPAKLLHHPVNVVEAFDRILDTRLFKELDTAMRYVHTLFSSRFSNGSDDSALLNVYSHLVQLQNGLRRNRTAFYQYLYDFADDLTQAYYEFMQNAQSIAVQCMPDENRFPLHVALGPASVNNDAAQTAYRNHFIHSPIFAGHKAQWNKAMLLYRRLVTMLEQFDIPEYTPGKDEAPAIRITPSQYGRGRTGKKCIPYYYNTSPLYQFWDPEKTRLGRERMNYGYFGTQYSNDASVANPLEYDTEPYNFFRIEGHAGQPVNAALRNIVQQKIKYSLPFDVVALNIYPGNSLEETDKLQCYFSDLESQYNLVLAEMLCKLHEITCAAGKLLFDEKILQVLQRGDSTSLMTASSASGTDLYRLFGEMVNKKPGNSVIFKYIKDSLLYGQVANNAEEGLRIVSSTRKKAVGFIEESRSKQNYRRGDFLSKFCKPAEGAGNVAEYYLNWKRNNPSASWPKPPAIPYGKSQNISSVMSAWILHQFYLIDLAEEVFARSIPYNLGELDFLEFSDTYTRLKKALGAYADNYSNLLNSIDITRDSSDPDNKFDHIAEEMEDWLIDKETGKMMAECSAIRMMCADERIRQLLAEYRKRLAYILEQNILSVYAQHKTGLEHKAGVTRGGTFVLLYYDEVNPRVDWEISPAMKQEGRMALAEKAADDNPENSPVGKPGKTVSQQVQRLAEMVDYYKEEFSETQVMQFREMLDEVMKLPESNTRMRLRPGTVIADLFLPYMCCSACAPVSFVLTPGKDEYTEVQLSIEFKTFCNDDQKEYPVNVVPQHAVVKGEGIIHRDGSYFFAPLALQEGEYPIEASAGNGSDSITVKVFAAANPGFQYVIKSQSEKEVEISFIPDFPGGSHRWNFGDDSVDSYQSHPTHTYPLSKKGISVEIAHTVSNGVCGSKETVQKIDITNKPIEKAHLTMEVNELCTNGDLGKLSYEPAGGIMECKENSNAIVSKDGTYYFDPGKSGAGSFTVSYSTSTDAAYLTIVVREAHSAAFRYEVVQQNEKAILIKFIPEIQFGNHTWKFSDGQTSDAIEPALEFNYTPEKPFNLTATHIVDNGVCKEVLTQEIALKQESSVEKLNLCFGSAYPVMLEPNLPPESEVKAVNTGDHELDSRGRLTLSSSTPVGESVVQMEYQVTGPWGSQLKRVEVLIYRINEQVELKQGNESLVFRALEAELSASKWLVEAHDRNGNLLLSSPGSKNPFELKLPNKNLKVDTAIISVELQARKCAVKVKKTIQANQIKTLAEKGTIII